MKKWIKAILAVMSASIFALSLAACNGGNEAPDFDPAPVPPEYTETATLVADFGDGPKGVSQKEYFQGYSGELDISMLSGGLSDLTGLDFFVSGSVEGGKAFISWGDASTLVAGLDDREQNPDFFFYDSVSLNWFMMDSLATTVKANFPEVTEVYYSGENGEPIVFSNPEDMASQGLPVLPADLPYEGSAFFIAHAGGRGDTATRWSGVYTSEDEQYLLSFGDYEGQSVRFAFLSDESSRDGTAVVSPDNIELAESEDFTFWFLDENTLVVAGGAFEATYVRNEGAMG